MSVLEPSRRSGVARNTIAALADALGVPLASLLEAPREGAHVVREGEGAHVEGAAVAHIYEALGGAAAEGTLLILTGRSR
jgi:hypothetical protein